MQSRPPLFIIFLIDIIWAISIPSPSEFEDELVELTDRVIERHFTEFRCVTYVLNEDTEMVPGRRLPAVIIRLPTERWILTETFEQGCGGYIVRVYNKSEAVRLLIDAKHHATGFRYNNQKYLFLPVNETDVDLELLKDSKLYFFPNWVLVTPDNDTLSASTHTVFDGQNHVDVTREILDVWIPEKGFKFGRDLYPDKISDVKGKKFVFAVVNYSPFSIVRKEGQTTMFDGFETRIAAEFVRTVNGTWEGLDHPVDLWGEMFPNGTGNGIVGSVASRKADFGYAAFYQWFCEDFDCTYPFYQSAVTCLVPRPELVSGWLTIVLPFTPDTWVALSIVYFFSSSFLFFVILLMQMQKGFKLRDHIGMAASDSFFTNFRIQLEQIPVIPKSKQPVSVYVKITVYYYFFVAAFWQGGIASILTVPRFEDPINDVTDLVKRWPKLTWGSNTNAWVNSIRGSTEPNLVQIVHKFVVSDEETLSRKIKTKDFAFFVERLPHGHYGLGDYITEDSMKYLRLMEKNIYTAFGVLILPKGSPYSEKFDRTILRLFDSGVVHKMEVQVSLERINNRLQNMVEFSNVKDSSIVILAIRHIQGPIFIYLAGVSLASLVFCLEVFVLRKNRILISPNST